MVRASEIPVQQDICRLAALLRIGNAVGDIFHKDTWVGTPETVNGLLYIAHRKEIPARDLCRSVLGYHSENKLLNCRGVLKLVDHHDGKIVGKLLCQR